MKLPLSPSYVKSHDLFMVISPEGEVTVVGCTHHEESESLCSKHFPAHFRAIMKKAEYNPGYPLEFLLAHGFVRAGIQFRCGKACFVFINSGKEIRQATIEGILSGIKDADSCEAPLRISVEKPSGGFRELETTPKDWLLQA